MSNGTLYELLVAKHGKEEVERRLRLPVESSTAIEED